MIEPPSIVGLPARSTAFIAFSVTPAEMREAMGPGFQELMAALQSQGLRPAGPVCAHHLHRPGARFEFELTVSVAQRVTPTGRVQPGQWPAMRAVRTVYHGAYEGLPAAWGEFTQWIAAHDVAVAPDFYECYLLGPRTSADSADWRTEFISPLADCPF